MIMKMVIYPIENGDLPIENGDLAIENDDLAIENDDLAIENGDLAIQHGDFPVRVSGSGLIFDVGWPKKSRIDSGPPPSALESFPAIDPGSGCVATNGVSQPYDGMYL